MKYDFEKIEKKWQKIWEEKKYAPWKVKKTSGKKNTYILDMFPYPSGSGLHTGHIEGYTATDILSRYYRMQGHQVLHPMGWDAFGLPAENYALKMKKNPMSFVPTNIELMKKQLKKMGFSYDWSREISTTDPAYYTWTQWMFLQMYKKGLVYEAESPINFCPSCKTGLANEEVVGGRCDRCGSETETRMLSQWHIKITQYADRLLEGLDGLGWPESIKELQRNWIGKSEGYEITFKTEDKENTISVFTTRLDTLFGVTFLVLAPEHQMALKIAKGDYYFITENYIENAQKRTAKERRSSDEVSGVFTGSYVVHPFTKIRIPVWVSEYVLFDYGTGAVMGVPAHDKRDHRFATRFHLSIEEVIAGKDVPHENYGVLKNSEEFTGLTSQEAIEKIGEQLMSSGIATKHIYYKLRDWVFSRQRYWGEPIPLIRCPHCGIVPVPEKDLPVTLPPVKSYAPSGTGESPLAKIKEWIEVKCPVCDKKATRETNTMPQWAGSCWYYLRYLDPKNKKVFASKESLKAWLPVTMYVGGAEHAVLHLLYARFWHMVLYDAKHVPTPEPFARLVNQGIILGPDHEKMSKSRGNVVNPDDITKEFGVDTLRMYEMFMGPFEDTKPWAQEGIRGIFRFLIRVWSIGLDVKKKNVPSSIKDDALLKGLHATIQKVGQDIPALKFNTAISAMMECSDMLRKKCDEGALSPNTFIDFLKILFPFAPYTTQELFHMLGKTTLLDSASWPTVNKKYLAQESKTIIIQVNGKKRLDFSVPLDMTFENIKTEAMKSPKVKIYLKGKKILKTIFAQDRIINFVVKE